MAGTDGYLKIKTKIDNSDVDKDIANLENKINKMQNENSSLSKEQRGLQEKVNKYEQLKSKVEECNKELQTLYSIENGNVININPSRAAQLKIEIMEAKQEMEKQSTQLEKVYSKLDKVKAKQSENNEKISEFKRKIESIKVKNVEKNLDNVGKSISSQIGKIGKMAMAVVGVRSAWALVSRAVALVKQYNPQVSTDFEYMAYALSNILVPAVQGFVKLLYTILSYINAISTAWFGINLFSNSSVKNFQKMKNSATGTAKATKEINKNLAGFDEAYVLQDKSSSGGSGVSTPSMDLSSMQSEIPAWLKFIIDNKDLILEVLGGISAGILAIKFGCEGIKAIGIGIFVAGIIGLIESIIKYLNNPSWENFGKIISNIGLIIAGLGIIVTGIPAIIAGAVLAIVGLVVSNWDKIKEILQSAVEWMYSKMDWVKENFGLFGQAIWQGMIDLVETGIDIFDGLFSGIKNILDGIIKVFKGIFTGDMKTVLEGFKQIFKGIFESLYSIAIKPLNLIIKSINHLINGTNKINFDIPSWVPGFGGKKFGFNIPKIPLLAKGTVLTRPTPVIAGEAGAEMVAPLENNTEWIDILASKLASKMGKTNGGSYIIQLDSRVIQRGIAKKKQELAFETNGGM